jgi:putative CocE/NonD family hydrolase
MKGRVLLSVAVLAALVASAALMAAGPYRERILWAVEAGSPDIADAMIPMRDGVRLATDVYLPSQRDPVPAVLLRLPYGKRSYGEIRFWVNELSARGFATVVQDMRGRHGSEGVFAPYPNAGADGAATLDWIVAQPWSNGRVGSLGCSALGESQLMLGKQNHPALRAMVPIAAGGAIGTAGGRNGYFAAFEGGIFNLAAGVGWFSTEGGKTPGDMGPGGGEVAAALRALPVIEAVSKLREGPTDYEDFLRKFENEAYWRKAGYVTDADRFWAPALFIDTWHDLGISSALTLAERVRASGNETHSIIGAGTHCAYLGTAGNTTVGDLPVSPKTHLDYVGIITGFLAHYLADGPAPDLPPYLYYMLVEDSWREAQSWPPQEAAPLRLALAADGSLQSVAGAWPGGRRSFRSDPFDPVPSVGGAICCTGEPGEVAGPVYQNSIEARDDLLIWTSRPLDHPLRIAGPVRARLQVSADVPDTDLVLRLTDVDPEGRSLLVQEGALRLRYREGFDAPRLMQPGEVYSATVDMRDIAWMLRPGHRLRLHVAGTSFPRLERNMNTGGRNYDETEGRVAHVTVHSSPDHPSVLELFALPE